MTSTHPREAELLRATDAMCPGLLAAAEVSDRERKLPDWFGPALHEMGWYRFHVPASMGGYEPEPMAAARVLERLGEADLSAAWVALNLGTPITLPRYPEAAQRELIGDSSGFGIATGLNPGRMRGEPAEGGFTVSGFSPWCSGSQFAEMFTVAFLVTDGGKVRQVPESSTGVDMRIASLVRDEVTILDNWDGHGLRATSSHDVQLDDVFVPSSRVVAFVPNAVGSLGDSPFYRVHRTQGRMATAILGATTGAIEAFNETIQRRKLGQSQPMTEMHHVQDALGRAAAARDVGRVSLYDAFETSWAASQESEEADLAALPAFGATCQFVAESCVAAIDGLWKAAATSVVSRNKRLERIYRDVHTMMAHLELQGARFSQYGMHLLGKEPPPLARA